MTCWIEFHATKLVRLQKFHGLKKCLSLSKLETLGLLSLFWGEVIELRESGDISDWNPDYLCDLLGSKLVPDRVWEALELNGWIDRSSDGRILVHDWLDYAGRYLRGKYKTKNKSMLIEIWAIHGRKYGEQEEEAERLPQGSKEEVKKLPTLTLPNHTIPKNINSSTNVLEYVKFEKSTVEKWNSFCDKYPVLSKLITLNGTRRQHLKKRFSQETFKDFDKILSVIPGQKFLLGENDRAWKISFDWLIGNDNNHVKVLENKYLNQTVNLNPWVNDQGEVRTN